MDQRSVLDGRRRQQGPALGRGTQQHQYGFDMMIDSRSRHFRYRLFAGIYLGVFLVVIIAGLLATRFPMPTLVLASLPLVVLCLVVLRRKRIVFQQEDKPSTVGELSRDELRVARSKLKRIE